MTLTYPNGDELGLRFDAVVQPAGEGTAVAGSLQVIGGTGLLEGVTGSAHDDRRPHGPVGLSGGLRTSRSTWTVCPTRLRSGRRAPVSGQVVDDPDATGVELMTYYSDLLVAKDQDALDRRCWATASSSSAPTARYRRRPTTRASCRTSPPSRSRSPSRPAPAT